MKKRQIKKNEKLHVKLVADESVLLFLDEEERKFALDQYVDYRWRLAKMPYRQLKRMKGQYYFEMPARKILEIGKAPSGKTTLISQFVSQNVEGIDLDIVQRMKQF